MKSNVSIKKVCLKFIKFTERIDDGPDQDFNPDPLNCKSGALQNEISSASLLLTNHIGKICKIER